MNSYRTQKKHIWCQERNDGQETEERSVGRMIGGLQKEYYNGGTLNVDIREVTL